MLLALDALANMSSPPGRRKVDGGGVKGAREAVEVLTLDESEEKECAGDDKRGGEPVRGHH